MPQRGTEFRGVNFKAVVVREAVEKFGESAARHASSLSVEWADMSIRTGRDQWTFDDSDEFLGELDKPRDRAHLVIHAWDKGHEMVGDMRLDFWGVQTDVRVELPTKGLVQQVMSIFETHEDECRVPMPPPAPKPKPVVFIGHGRSAAWRDLKDHLTDKQGYEVQAYETGARAGHTIRDILERLLIESTFALLVMTGEDEQADATTRARQNVVHEAGLFQGALGFHRAIILLEQDVSLFSNVDGIQYIPFSKGNIKETFGEVVATLRREFPDG